MAVNYGLLTDMSSGIKEGLLAYNTVQQQNRQNQMFNLLNGTQTDENGTLQYTPMKQQQIALQNQAQQAQYKKQVSLDDPTSEESKAQRGLISQITGQQVPENVSGNDAKQYSQLFAAKIKENGQENVANSKNDIASQMAQDRHDKQAQKTSDDQEKAYSTMNDRMLTSRGNKVVQQAGMNQLAVENIKSLLNRYPNLDDMPETQYNTLIDEYAKLALGGVPGEGGVHSLSNDTYQSNWNSFMSKVGNKPTGAQLGDFIKENRPYAEDIGQNSNNIINDYRMNVYKGYRNRFSQDQRNRFEQQDHPEMFKGQGGSGLLGQAQGVPDGRITVKDPSGNIGHIPAAQLQDALKQGYQQVK